MGDMEPETNNNSDAESSDMPADEMDTQSNSVPGPLAKVSPMLGNQTEKTVRLESRIEVYHAISEWIRFADAKAAVLLTIGGALAGFLIPTVRGVLIHSQQEHWLPYWSTITLVLFVCYVVFFILSSFFAFLCINPLRKRGRHPSLGHCQLFHPAAVSNKYGMDDLERFYADCASGEESQMQKQVQAAILLDSHISAKKYERVSASIKLFGFSAAFGFSYFLLAQL